MLSTYFSHLSCSNCKKTYSPDVVQTFCQQCAKPLLAEYDLIAARKNLVLDEIQKREGTMWRYRELLPVFKDQYIVSLGEGWTPMIQARKLGEDIGIDCLLIKEEGCNPTGSFKARGLSMAVSKAVELGINEVSMPSAGNAGGALAAYSAKAGLKSHIFVPKDSPVINIKEVALYGAEVTLVDGVISDAGKKMNEMKQGTNWFDMSTMKEPYRLEGKKTMGYEIAEQCGWVLPDAIVYPTGGGTGLIGMWKAFNEMEQLGWISSKRPKMISVQSRGCAPIVKAFSEGKKESAFWQNAQTIASGLRVPKAFADTLILDAISESHGTAIAVSDKELLDEMKNAATTEGIFLCPEGAAAIAAVRQLCAEYVILPTDKTVVFNTGSGYKYVELFT